MRTINITLKDLSENPIEQYTTYNRPIDNYYRSPIKRGTEDLEYKEMSPNINLSNAEVLDEVSIIKMKGSKSDAAYQIDLRSVVSSPEVARRVRSNSSESNEYNDQLMSYSSLLGSPGDGFKLNVSDEEDSVLELKSDPVYEQQRIIMNELSKSERAKFKKLEKYVAKYGYPYRAIEIAQFLIVSHEDLKESESRMKRWRDLLKEHKADKVEIGQSLEFLRVFSNLSGIGGYEQEGRRIYCLNFGIIPVQSVLAQFPVFSKAMNILWDSLAINITEIRAGVCFVGNFEGFSAGNWSLKLFMRFMQMWQDKYPVRVRRLYLVDTPVYFWVVAKVVMSFTSKKFKERFKFVSREELVKVLPLASLPTCLGGSFDEDLQFVPWIVNRLQQRSGRDWVSLYSD